MYDFSKGCRAVNLTTGQRARYKQRVGFTTVLNAVGARADHKVAIKGRNRRVWALHVSTNEDNIWSGVAVYEHHDLDVLRAYAALTL